MSRRSSLTTLVFCLVFALFAGFQAASAAASPLDGDPIAASSCEDEHPENPEVCEAGEGIEPIEIEPDKAVWTPKIPSGARGGDFAGRLAAWLDALQGLWGELGARLGSGAR